MKLLITNDDGINSEGLKALTEVLGELGEVFVVAPDRQRSAVGLSITLERPLRVMRVGKKTFSVDGMPADCVTLAVHELMGSLPDLIVSGINNGQNLGYDIYHSGTVGAALVGAMFGIPSMAVSIANWIQDSRHKTQDFRNETQNEEEKGGKWESRKVGKREGSQEAGVSLESGVLDLESSKGIIFYDTAAQMALKLARVIFERGLLSGTLLNINVPNVSLSEIKGIEVAKHCNATYDVEIHHRLDPRGRKYYWLGGEFQRYSDNSKTDLSVLCDHKVSVTPLRLDLTDYEMMQGLSDWIEAFSISGS
jgi:5'-nucleotidase